MLRRSAPLVVLLALALLPLTAFGADPVSIEADVLEFTADGQAVQAEGHVVLSYQDIVLRAASLAYLGEVVTATGDVHLIAKEADLFAARLELNLRTRELRAEEIRGHVGGFHVQGKSIAPGEPGEQVLTDAGVTRCDREVPCYALRAGRISIAGSTVTVERGWLFLKGHRVLPFPRVTLDLERTEEWPEIYGGYGADGLFLGAGFTLTIAESVHLVLEGETAAKDPLSVRATLAWRPSKTAALDPWLSYSVADGFGVGIDTSYELHGTTISLQASRDWSESLLDTRLSASRPLHRADTREWRLEGFWSTERPLAGDETSELGATLTWALLDREAAFGLTAGRMLSAGSSTPLARLHVEIAERPGGNWGWDARLTYDLVEGNWYEGSIGLTRHLHCFFLRLGYDVTKETLETSVGVSF